jgi:hypothetical protein
MRTALVVTALVVTVLGAVAGCAPGTSTLVLSVGASAPVAGIDHLEIDATDAHGRPSHVKVALAGAPITLSAPIAAALQFEATTDGKVHLVVKAVDGPGTALASAETDATVRPSHTQTLMLTLTPTTPSGGALRFDRAQLDFGAVVVASRSASATLTLTNGGDVATGALVTSRDGDGAAQFTVDSDGCAGQTLAPGGHCSLAVRFEPSAAGDARATLRVGGMPGGSGEVALSGSGVPAGALSISPPEVSFGGVAVGADSGDNVFTIKNGGSEPSGAVTVGLNGKDGTEFVIAKTDCGASLPPNGTCSATVRFHPNSTTSKVASLVASATPGGSGVAALSGVGLGPPVLGLSPSPQDFGSVVVAGSSANFAFEVSNTGGQPSGPLMIVSANATEFPIVANECGSAPLAAGARCAVTLKMVPGGTGTRSGMLTVSGGMSGGGSSSSMLTGTGIAAAALAFSPGTKDFGSVEVGSMSSPVTYTLTNSGAVATGAIISTIGGGSDFVVTDNCNGKTLTAAGGSSPSCTYVVVFKPGTFGGKTLSLKAESMPGGTATASGSGIGTDKVVLTVTRDGFGGSGQFVSTPAGIDCGTTCSASFARNTSVTLKATCLFYWQGWGGACASAGQSLTCTLTLDAAKSVQTYCEQD